MLYVPNTTLADALFNLWQGPVTEEIVFRACILAVYHVAGASRSKMIFLSPLWFGVGTYLSKDFVKDVDDQYSIIFPLPFPSSSTPCMGYLQSLWKDHFSSQAGGDYHM